MEVARLFDNNESKETHELAQLGFRFDAKMEGGSAGSARHVCKHRHSSACLPNRTTMTGR